MENNDKSQVRTRIAPSPTGYMHIGTLRTALYSYLLAKQAGGQFILRLEDTDQKRFVEGAAEAIYNGLKWAGLKYDEGPDIGGPFAPYIQSQRLDIYKRYAKELIDKDHAYYCFCDKATLEAMRQEQTDKKQAPKYDRRCLKLSKEGIAKKLAGKAPYVIRMKIPGDRILKFTDMVRGELVFNSNELDDQVLLKSDGYPTYFLAVTVDDYLTKITHVTRTEEWLSSFPKLILLYEYLGWEMPQFAHLPLLLNTDKTKMSKRKGDVAVADYIKKGYLPEAMINYLAFLGWNPGLPSEALAKEGREKEIYSMEELLKEFSLDRVHKAGAVFNIEKLNWYNAYYLKKREPRQYITEITGRIKLPGVSEVSIVKAIEIEKERSQTENELKDKVVAIFDQPLYEKEILRWKKLSDGEIKDSLETSKKILSAIPDENFNAENIKNILMAEAEKIGDKGSLLWPLRVSLSGQKNSPPPFDLAEILRKEETIKRIESAQNLLS